MSPLEYQKIRYRDKFKTVYREQFQGWFEELARAIYPGGDFQGIRLTRGDGALDGFAIDQQIAFQVYAPPRINELRDGETSRKISADFEGALSTLEGNLKKWVFVHNHPESQLGADSIAEISRLRTRHPNIEIAVWGIHELWEQIAKLPERERAVLFPGADQHGVVVGGKSTARVPDDDFVVPVLKRRIPIREVWDQLQWLKKTDGADESLSLDQEMRRYYEWWRLARSEHGNQFSASTLLNGAGRHIIVGGPGSGKSTLARKLSWQTASRGNLSARVPLRSVARLVADGVRFEDALQKCAIFEATNFQGDLKVERAAALIADGLDETEPNRFLVAEGLSAWGRNNAEVTIVVTTRPVGHVSALMPEFTTAELQPLSERAVEGIARIMIGESSGNDSGAKQLLEHIVPGRGAAPITSAAHLAARNPLLLSFLVALHINRKAIARSRSNLYSSIIELCRVCPVNDRVVSEMIQPTALGLGFDALAWTSLNEPGSNQLQQIQAVTAAFQRHGVPSMIEAAELANDVVRFWADRRLIEVLAVGHDEVIASVHPTLAEFGAARYLSRLSADERLVWLQRNSRKAWAREIILLSVGLPGGEAVASELLSFDRLDDVASTEAIVACLGIAERGAVSTELANEIGARVCAKLSSPVPLISVEAADALRAAASCLPAAMLPLCRPLYEHPQPWTALGSRALGLLMRDKEMLASTMADWLVPEANAASGHHWYEWPSGVYELRKTVIILGFERIFEDSPLEYARDAAARFVKSGRYSWGEANELANVFDRYGCRDLFRERDEQSAQRVAEMLNFDGKGKVERAYGNLCRAILIATGEPQKSEVAAPGVVAQALAKFLSATGLGEAPLTSIWSLAADEYPVIIAEVFKGAIKASGVSAKELAHDANVVLSLQEMYEKIEEVIPSHPAVSMHWDRCAGMGLCGKLLTCALVYSAEYIRVLAGNLIANQAADSLPSLIAQGLLFEAEGINLRYLSGLANSFWGARGLEVLEQRMSQAPRVGLENVCEAIGKVASVEERLHASEILLVAAADPDLRVAKAAVEAILEMGVKSVAIRQGLEDGFLHWQRIELRCPECAKPLENDACPVCHVIPPSPHEAFVRAIDAISPMDEDQLLKLAARSGRFLHKAPEEILSRRAEKDRNVLFSLLTHGRGECPQIVACLLELPNEALAQAIDLVIALRHAKDANARRSFFCKLPSLRLPHGAASQYAKEGLADASAIVRDQAAKAVRLLSA